jgi:acetoin:2,6-dichlorophenolindophenol oxidoreductase subunit alpha
MLKRALFCRAFEDCLYDQVKKGNINIPVYLSAGQEIIPAVISSICEKINIKPMIFAQHRCHSTYISFGGDYIRLIHELLGLPTGCSNGMGGSASIHDQKIKMFGHDGMMGSNIPIGTGACYASKQPTIVFAGDAAAEEDYALASYGWAATHNLPILFVVEDNNLSILTEKFVRRNWEIAPVAQAMGVESYSIIDTHEQITKYSQNFFKGPVLLNIETVRKYWHSGAGTDGDQYDYLRDHDLTPFKNVINQQWEKALRLL